MRTILRALTRLLLAGGLWAQTTLPLGMTNKTPELQALVSARIFISQSSDYNSNPTPIVQSLVR